MAGGNRSFPLLSVNVARVRIRAKLMDAHTAIHALRGYGSYFASERERRESDDWDEPYRSLITTWFPEPRSLTRNSALVWTRRSLTSRTNSTSAGMNYWVAAGPAWYSWTRDGQAATIRTRRLVTQALIQLTDLGLVWKKSQTGVDVFVFSHQTGETVAGATARLFGDENQLLGQAVADTNGTAHLDANTNAAWVAVQHKGDFHAVTLDENRIWLYRFELPYTGYEENEDTRRVMLFSDRDLYRPGEGMHLEAIVRDWGSQGLTVPIGSTGTLQCLDARDKRFFQTNVVLSSLGSWSTLVPLPTGSRGSYTATLRFGTNDSSRDDYRDYRYTFLVQDFKPNAFEIPLPCKEEYSAGEPVRLPLSARYLFGKSLSRAQVKWSLEANGYGFPAGEVSNLQLPAERLRIAIWARPVLTIVKRPGHIDGRHQFHHRAHAVRQSRCPPAAHRVVARRGNRCQPADAVAPRGVRVA